jgi:hypothetical protein
MEYKNVGARVSIFGDVAVFGSTGEVPNTTSAALPTLSEVGHVLDELDQYRENPRGVDFGPIEAKVKQAGHDWPQKQSDLKARLNRFHTESVTLWRVRDSVDPLRKRGEPIDHSKIDRLQLLAAYEVTKNWDENIDSRVRDLDGLVDQLYSSWETTLISIAPVSDRGSRACRAGIRRVLSRITEADATTIVSSAEPTVDVAECSCLSQTRVGQLLARKAFGQYDSEVKNFSACDGDAAISLSRVADLTGSKGPSAMETTLQDERESGRNDWARPTHR